MLHSQGSELPHPQSRIGERQHHIALISRSVSQRFHLARGQVPAPREPLPGQLAPRRQVRASRLALTASTRTDDSTPSTLRTVPRARPYADNSLTQVCTSSKVTFDTGTEPYRGMTCRVRIDVFRARVDADQPG